MLLKLSKFFTSASLFCVLIVLTGAFFPFIGGKTYWFRIAIELAVVFAVFWWAFDVRGDEARRNIREAFRKPIVIAVSLFVAAFLLATLFADNPYAAFWSNYERGEGGFQMLHYYAFFILLVLFFNKREDWERIFKVAVVAALGMVLYGAASAVIVKSSAGAYSNPFGFVSAYIGPQGGPISPTFFGRLFSPQVRFQGSLGNPAYVAPYLMFAMFYCLYLGMQRPRRRWWWVAGAVLFLIFIVLTQTRGAFIGVGVAVTVFFFYCALRGEGKLRRASLAFLVLLLLFNAMMFFFRSSPLIKQIPFAGRLYDVASIESFSTRLWTWGSAWEGFKERPLLGWGPENFPAVFDKHFNPRHYVPGKATETWFDRAHSVVFDYLAETGLIGFLAYASIFFAFAAQFFSRARLARADSAALTALVLALPVGYLVQASALFDVLPIYTNLFLFFAFAAWWFGNDVVPEARVSQQS